MQDFETYALTHRMYGYIPESRRFVLDQNIRKGMKVLDVGCGDGQHLEYLSQKLPKDDLFGTEISQIRVDRVKEKGFNCVKVNGDYLPFEDRFFDAIVFFEVIEHIPEGEVDTMLTEMVRVLKPEGVIVGSTPNYPAKLYYAFFMRLSDRFRMLLGLNKPRSQNQTEEVIFPSERQKTGYLHEQSVNTRKTSWILRQVKRLLADDPTHQFFCDFNIIYNLGKKYFRAVELYTTFSGKAKPINISNPKKYLSHKIVFVFKK